ncbi:hypothetical protein niasHS_014434 [Heterodera schachtii]|uniref:COMM domain-containing protein n=1 Tax=Heterodera schachtii TaxID=97005 RepID=A0ABD2I3B3_HETSC
MKFHFNGGLDCPEWILSQIPEIAKTDTKTLQTLGSSIIEMAKAKQTEWHETDIKKFCFGEMSVDGLRALKAKIAALLFILEKTTKNDCSCKDLEKELLQLGLPSDHVSVLVELYDSNRAALCDSLAGPAIKAPSLTVVRKEQLPTVADPSVKSDYFRLDTTSSDGSTATLLIHRDELVQLRTCMEDAVKVLESLVVNKE